MVELGELKTQKVVQENKLDLMKNLLEEAKAQTEALKKVLKDKEDEISKSKKELHQAKEDAIKEYHDSDAFLAELAVPLLTTSTTASVKSRLPSQIWTYPTSLLIPKARPLPVLQTPRAPTSYLQMTPPPTLKVTRKLLLIMIKLNPSRRSPVHLKGITQLKRRMERPWLANS